MKAYIIKCVLWGLLFLFLYINVGFWSLVLDIREDNKLDRQIRREQKRKENDKQ